MSTRRVTAPTALLVCNVESNQVTSQRGLHCDISSFLVADFTHHHDIRILTQNGAKTTRKGHVHTLVDLGLPDPFQVILDGVFHRQDIARAIVERGQPGVQRGGLA